MTITSPHNEKLKAIRKLRQRRRERERSGRFTAEGEDLLAAADAAGWVALERYCAAGSGLAGVEVEARLLASASGLASGTRTLGVYQERWAEAALGPLCVYLHGVTDPGNVGAVLRSAEAFGASCLAVGPGCADPYAPKAVRASMGAIFAVPLTRVADAGQLPGSKIALVARAGVQLTSLAPTPRASETSVRLDGDQTPDARTRAITLLVGSERQGLPDHIVAGADHVAHIPIASHSLNVAMAATIGLYELTRRMAPA